MGKFKFTLFSIIILVLVVFIGYWAFSTIESGTDHVYDQEIKQLKQENKELKDEIDSLVSQVEELSPDEQEEKIIQPEITKEIPSKHQSLIGDLQKLINDKVVMKKGSKGERVGIIQTFLNIYNNTSTRVDNDYGAKTITALKKFEEEQKLIITEEIGPNTFQVMIDWLKKQ